MVNRLVAIIPAAIVQSTPVQSLSSSSHRSCRARPRAGRCTIGAPIVIGGLEYNFTGRAGASAEKGVARSYNVSRSNILQL